MQLNTKQSQAERLIISGKNLFITGAGGVGKSVLVRRIREHFSDSTVFLAPTGIAALNINGSTIHSAFKFGLRVLTDRDYGKISPRLIELFGNESPVKRIVVDEISMVRKDIFIAMDQKLQRIRKNKLPFGGLQIIVVGDFFQLPPVVANHEKEFYRNYHGDSPYAFASKSWSASRFETIELDEIMRQSDATFIHHLRNIRTKSGDYRGSIDFFNTYNNDKILSNVLDEDPVVLSTTNAIANSVNSENYSELEGEEQEFHAIKTGDFSSVPAEPTIRLKYGTKVICVANNDIHKNGQIGYVVGFVGADTVKVMLEDESTIFVKPHKWEEIEYHVKNGSLEVETKGTYTQLPLRYAWGITIHKSQGQTLPNAVVDIGKGAFCHGQLYVALSRIKTLEGMALMSKLSYSDVIVDKEVVEFYEGGCRGNGLF